MRELRERIRKVIKETGYHPINSAQTSSASRKPTLLALLFQKITPDFYWKMSRRHRPCTGQTEATSACWLMHQQSMSGGSCALPQIPFHDRNVDGIVHESERFIHAPNTKERLETPVSSFDRDH